MADDGSGRSESRQVSVKDLIPESRLAVVVGDFFVSDPVVYDGDDVYEVNLMPDADHAHRQACIRFSDMEAWMLPDTEYMFLRCIAGAEANDVENFIVYAAKNHWLGGKNISLNLDVGKTIFNRQTKLVLHNSKTQKTLDYHIKNASQPLKKTNFILEDWPYVSLNEPLILKGTDDELAPWMRSQNKQFNTCISTRLNKKSQSDFSTHDYNFLQDHWKLQQTQQHQQPHQLYQRQQQQQQQQHLHKLYQQQRQYQQQLQYQHQQQHLQQQLQQRAIFLTPSPSHQQVFIYGQHLMIGTYLSNITFQQWPSNFYQRFPTPFLLPTHYHLDLKNNDSLTATKTQQ